MRLTNKRILEIASTLNYCRLYTVHDWYWIDTPSIGPGKTKWKRQLPKLPTTERAYLEEKITRVIERVEQCGGSRIAS